MEENKVYRVAIYARESSDDTETSPPIEQQISRAKQWISEKSYIFVETYSDDGFSGGNWNRPEWNRLIREAKGGKFSLVVTWSLDRLARDTEQFLFFCRHLKNRNVKVFSINDGEIDMDTLGGKIKNTTMAQAAEIFRLVISDKVKKVYEMKKRNAEKDGVKSNWGRPSIPYEISEIAIKIKSEHPEYGYNRIANLLPSYKTKKQRERKVSGMWVKKILGLNKSPPKNTLRKSDI